MQNMVFKGYKIRVRCLDWEQIDILDKYWKVFTDFIGKEKIVGLGMNWTDDFLYFDYAIGVINDDDAFSIIQNIDFSFSGFPVLYIELNLPDLNEWEIFQGKSDDIQEIYEKQIDSLNRSYDYELESIDSEGNMEIKIHFID